MSSRFKERMRERRKSMIICICVIFAILFAAVIVYGNDYYRADAKAVEEFMQDSNILEETLSDGSIACIPEIPTAGIIFYPGAKVEHTAYLPLMRALADEGVLAVVVKMPFNLAVLKESAADGIREQFPEVESWYMAGHSLGGSIAASYVEDHADSFEGLILIASYSTTDLSETDLKVATILGSLDEIMNRDAYDANEKNLPKDFEATVIKGGNHSGFGMYGLQDGDCEATISNTRQIKDSAQIIAKFVQ